VGSAPQEEADRVRDALALLARSPDRIGPLPDPARIEAMLAADAAESAALALTGGETGFMLSRGAGGTCLATIALPGGEEDVTAEGATVALALLAARLSALLAEATGRRDAQGGTMAASALRLN
jgi:hypothetical protein